MVAEEEEALELRQRLEVEEADYSLVEEVDWRYLLPWMDSGAMVPQAELWKWPVYRLASHRVLP